MVRWAGPLVATLLVAPWGGCERDPVTPPATPPPERAPAVAPQTGFDGIILRDAARKLG